METYLSEILSFIAGLGAGVTLKIGIDKRKSSKFTNSVNQTKNVVGGHQAGRDVHASGRPNDL